MIQKLDATITFEKELADVPPLTEICNQEFETKFNRSPFQIGHQLSGNELFSIERLLQLSRELPKESVEYNPGDIEISHDPNLTPQNGLTVEETIERIENCRSWMVLKNVERSSPYGELLTECLEQVRPFAEKVAGPMSNEQGFIFISSPGSVTPFHIDPENNFLLQIRGSKEVWMFDQKDREVLKETEIEEFFSGSHRNLEFKDEYYAHGERFELRPGQGLHFPVAAPHFVKNGPDVSVSFSITFQTKDSSDKQSLHRMNRQIRKFGLNPTDVGKSGWRDSVKLSLVRGMKLGRALLPK